MISVLGWGCDWRGWATGVMVIKKVGVGFGCGFVVGSNRSEFDLISGLDLVLGLCFGFTVRRRKGRGKSRHRRRRR